MIRGSKIELPKTPTRNVDIDLGIHNRFDIEVIDAKTGEVRQKAEAYNVVCNSYYSRINSGAYWFTHIHYGSGEGTPSAEDTGLFNEISNKQTAASGNEVVKHFPLEGYSYCRKSIQLAPEDAVGSTITEVGIGYNSGISSLCTHAMIKDMNGNQISILKTDTDVINIYATVYVHWNKDGYDNGHIKIFPNQPRGIIAALLGSYSPGSTTGIWGEKQYAVFYDGPACCSSPYYSHSFSPTVSRSVNATNKTITYTVTRLGVNDKNFRNGIQSMAVGGARVVYTGTSNTGEHVSGGIIITAPSQGLPGTTISGEAVATGDGTTVDYNTQFPFPKNAVVYIDGVATQDVIIDEDSPGSTDEADHFFEFIPEHSTSGFPYPLGSYGYYTSLVHRNSTGYAVFYNKCHKYGISYVSSNSSMTSYCSVWVSDDLVTWYEIGTAYQLNVPEEYQYYKYWRLRFASEYPKNYADNIKFYFSRVISYAKNIHFTTPPPEGSVITIDYYTPVVAKDENHVFDLTVTVHLGEYTE